MMRNPNMQNFFAEVALWAPRILGAIAILVIAWLIAKLVRAGIRKMVDRVPALQKHHQAEGKDQTLGALIGDVAYWLILLIGIMLALQPLGLSQVLEPVRQLTTNVFAFIPNVIAAGLIFTIGLVVAKIVRRLIETALIAANADQLVQSSGLRGNSRSGAAATADTSGSSSGSISKSVATVVFFLIMIPVTIAALEALKIEAISGPATQMLRTILDSLPLVLGALILLAIGYFVGKLAKGAIEQILPSMGFDRAVSALGVSPGSNAPSRTVGTVVMLAILLFFAIKAAELLRSPIIATMLAQILELGGQVLFGTVIILAGVVIARIVSSLVGGGWLSTILNWAIIALAVAMGLRFMGLANEIVIIAFAGVIGSAAVASALAFGLGGREPARQLLQRWSETGLPPAPTGGTSGRSVSDAVRLAVGGSGRAAAAPASPAPPVSAMGAAPVTTGTAGYTPAPGGGTSTGSDQTPPPPRQP